MPNTTCTDRTHYAIRTVRLLTVACVWLVSAFSYTVSADVSVSPGSFGFGAEGYFRSNEHIKAEGAFSVTRYGEREGRPLATQKFFFRGEIKETSRGKIAKIEKELNELVESVACRTDGIRAFVHAGGVVKVQLNVSEPLGSVDAFISETLIRGCNFSDASVSPKLSIQHFVGELSFGELSIGTIDDE